MSEKKKVANNARFISVKTAIGRYDMSECSVRKVAKAANAIKKMPGFRMMRIDVAAFEAFLTGEGRCPNG